MSQLLLEKVARKRIGYNMMRWGKPEPYPSESPAGPLVALTNEHAGSDGDIFSHCFKLMGIGKLVGKRTWGGVVGIWPRHALVDGSETTQPEFSFWFSDVGWGVENYGTDPEIDVDNAPQDAAAQRDRQLEQALATALQLAKRTPCLKPQVRRAAQPRAEAAAAAELTRTHAATLKCRHACQDLREVPLARHARRRHRGGAGQGRPARGNREDGVDHGGREGARDVVSPRVAARRHDEPVFQVAGRRCRIRRAPRRRHGADAARRRGSAPLPAHREPPRQRRAPPTCGRS